MEGDLGAQSAAPHPVSAADDEEEKDTPRRSVQEGSVCGMVRRANKILVVRPGKKTQGWLRWEEEKFWQCYTKINPRFGVFSMKNRKKRFYFGRAMAC